MRDKNIVFYTLNNFGNKGTTNLTYQHFTTFTTKFSILLVHKKVVFYNK